VPDCRGLQIVGYLGARQPVAIADYYKWQVPPDNRWLLDACAQVGWWEFVAKTPYMSY